MKASAVLGATAGSVGLIWLTAIYLPGWWQLFGVLAAAMLVMAALGILTRQHR